MDPEEDLPEDGEVVDFESAVADVEDTPDGGAIVTIDDGEHEQTENGFLDNLAETMPESELKDLASKFIELVEHDRKAREKRDKQYEDGIRRTGLGDDAPGGAQFQGASKVSIPCSPRLASISPAALSRNSCLRAVRPRTSFPAR